MADAYRALECICRLSFEVFICLKNYYALNYIHETVFRLTYDGDDDDDDDDDGKSV